MLKSMTRAAVAALALAWAAPAFAGGSVDVALTHESIRGEHGAVRAGTAAYLTVGGWYHLDNGQMINAGFHAIDPQNSRPELVAGLGGKTYLFKASGEDTSVAIGLGGFARYQPPNLNGFGGEVQAYYAPQVLAFSSLDQFLDLQVRVSYEVLPQGRLFVGYSHIQADYRDSVAEMDSALTLGFRVRY